MAVGTLAGYTTDQMQSAADIAAVYRQYGLNPAGGIAVGLNESDLISNRTQVGGGGGQGVFQDSPGGAASGLTQAEMNDPTFEATQAAKAIVAAGGNSKMTAQQIQDLQTTAYERPASVAADESAANLAKAEQILAALGGAVGPGSAAAGPPVPPAPTTAAAPALTPAQLASMKQGAADTTATLSSLGYLPTAPGTSQAGSQLVAGVDTLTAASLGNAEATPTATTPASSAGTSTPAAVAGNAGLSAGPGDKGVAPVGAAALKTAGAAMLAGYAPIGGMAGTMLNDADISTQAELYASETQAAGPQGVHPAVAAAISTVGTPGGVQGGKAVAAAKEVSAALGQVGTPYVWGGTTPGKGLDCSGLVWYAWKQAGVAIPRTTYTQLAGLPHGSLNPKTWTPGTLVYPESGHVGMYIGNDKIVEAPHTGTDVQVVPVTGSWAKPYAVRVPK